MIPSLLGFLAGAIAGSFLATLVIRWPGGRSLDGRSRCDSCNEPLRPGELLPLVSYLLQRGQCRRCGSRIDRRHFAIELAAALVGLVAFVAHDGPAGFATAMFGWWLLTLAALDAEHHWLPDRLTLPLIPTGLAVGLLSIGPDVGDRAIGATAGFVVLASLAWLYRSLRGREGLGGGDPKLLAAIGAWLGWQQLPIVLLGAGLVGLASLAAARARGKTVTATDRLPLGTLMAVTAWPIWLLTAP